MEETLHPAPQTHLPLRGEVSVTGGNTEQECVEVDELIGGQDRVGWLGRRMHLFQNLLREGLGNPVEVHATLERAHKCSTKSTYW